MFKKERNAIKRAKINGDIVHYDYCYQSPLNLEMADHLAKIYMPLGEGTIHDVNGIPINSDYQLWMFYVKRS